MPGDVRPTRSPTPRGPRERSPISPLTLDRSSTPKTPVPHPRTLRPRRRDRLLLVCSLGEKEGPQAQDRPERIRQGLGTRRRPRPRAGGCPAGVAHVRRAMPLGHEPPALPPILAAVSSRVAGKHCCFPAPSELHVTVARHAAQAFTNAPRGTRPLWQRPSRYAPGADGPSARPSSLRGSASRAHDREPHQQAFLPPTYLLVSLSRLAEVLS